MVEYCTALDSNHPVKEPYDEAGKIGHVIKRYQIKSELLMLIGSIMYPNMRPAASADHGLLWRKSRQSVGFRIPKEVAAYRDIIYISSNTLESVSILHRLEGLR